MSSMKDNMEWINRTLAANKLQAAGPMRIITSELGRETYTFDIAVPVRAGGAAASADASDEGEGEAADLADRAVAEEVGKLSGEKFHSLDVVLLSVARRLHAQ